MKNISCFNSSKSIVLPNRAVYLGGDENPTAVANQAPKEKSAQEVFAEITKAVKALESEKKGVEKTHEKVVNEVLNLMLCSRDFFSPELLTALAKRGEAKIRLVVAYNRNTPKDVLTKLATDKNEDVRREVAYNRNTPKEVLRTLARDNDELVRQYAIQNLDEAAEKRIRDKK